MGAEKVVINIKGISRRLGYFLHENEITLYGAGNDGGFFLDHLRYLGANVVAFCDSHKEGYFLGLPIVKPETLKNGGGGILSSLPAAIEKRS
jgi:hypothetical protein